MTLSVPKFLSESQTPDCAGSPGNANIHFSPDYLPTWSVLLLVAMVGVGVRPSSGDARKGGHNQKKKICSLINACQSAYYAVYTKVDHETHEYWGRIPGGSVIVWSPPQDVYAFRRAWELKLRLTCVVNAPVSGIVYGLYKPGSVLTLRLETWMSHSFSLESF